MKLPNARRFWRSLFAALTLDQLAFVIRAFT